MRGAGYQPNKQTNKQTDSEAQKLVNILAERSQIGTQADINIFLFHLDQVGKMFSICVA